MSSEFGLMAPKQTVFSICMVSATSKNHKNRQNQSNECSIFGNIFPQTRPCLKITNHNQKIIFFSGFSGFQAMIFFVFVRKENWSYITKEKKL